MVETTGLLITLQVNKMSIIRELFFCSKHSDEWRDGRTQEAVVAGGRHPGGYVADEAHGPVYPCARSSRPSEGVTVCTLPAPRTHR